MILFTTTFSVYIAGVRFIFFLALSVFAATVHLDLLHLTAYADPAD